IMDGLGSASPPVAPTATTGEGRHPCTWPRTFWFKPLSAFGLLDLTTFISSSPELAMPSTLAPNRLSASSRRALSREARPPWVGEVTLSQELRTARSPRPHVLVGYQWSHTGLRPGRKTSHNRYIRSFVSHPPQIRTCGTRNSSRHTSSIHLPSAYNRVFGTSPVGRMVPGPSPEGSTRRVIMRRSPTTVSNSERGYHVFSDVGTKLEFVGFNEAVHVRVATDIFSRIGFTRCLSDPYIPSADVATSSLEIRVAIRQFG